MADFFTAIRYGFQGYFDFKSRSTRAEYWYWSLFTVLGVLALVLLMPLAIFSVSQLQSRHWQYVSGAFTTRIALVGGCS